ncbi:MAG: lysozyme inhibitor LprI family protein [Neisseria sp.]|nr:lysozyme inhibitor LprI family protein [Neisseria sp.]
MMRQTILAAIIGTAAATAAAEPKYRPSYDTCIEKAVSTADTRDCIRQELAYQDGRLNTAYQNLMRQYPPAQRKILREAQRGWNVYKSKSTELLAAREGTMYRVMADGYYLHLTAARADELEKDAALMKR